MADGAERCVEPVTVLLVDVDSLARIGLGTIVDACTRARVVGEASDAAEAVEKALQLKPDIVVRGRTDEPDGGAERFRQLAAQAPEIRTIVVGERDGLLEVEAAFASGASGFLVRSSAPEQLEQALREVSAGQLFVDPETGGRLAAAMARQALRPAHPHRAAVGDALTERERQVLTLISRGLTNREIAPRLGISYRTVERHRTSLARKLGRRQRSQLAEYARDHHLA